MPFCTSCGKKYQLESKFCTQCGQTIDSGKETKNTIHSEVNTESSYQGYSQKINDPFIAKFKNKNKNAALIFLIVIAITSLVAVFILSGKDLGIALLTWLIVFTFTIVMTIISSSKSRRGWDGYLENKKVVVKTRHDNDSDAMPYKEEFPTLYFRTDDGKQRKIQLRGGQQIYNYYNIGDKVRKHPFFSYPEKLFKTSQTVCIYCGTVLDIKEDKCHKCRVPVMK